MLENFVDRCTHLQVIFAHFYIPNQLQYHLRREKSESSSSVDFIIFQMYRLQQWWMVFRIVARPNQVQEKRTLGLTKRYFFL